MRKIDKIDRRKLSELIEKYNHEHNVMIFDTTQLIREHNAEYDWQEEGCYCLIIESPELHDIFEPYLNGRCYCQFFGGQLEWGRDDMYCISYFRTRAEAYKAVIILRKLGVTCPIDMTIGALTCEPYRTYGEKKTPKEKIIAAMAAAGYDYDDIDSYDECLVFRGNYTKMEFSSWNDALEWLEGVVFDDPEISDNVERILHPENF